MARLPREVATVSARAWVARRRHCGVESEYGVCYLTRNHKRGHQVFIGGGKHNGGGPPIGFAFGDGVRPGYVRFTGPIP